MNDLKANIGALMKEISGSDVSPDQVHRIYAIAHHMGIDHADPIIPLIAAMDVYYGSFSRLPDKVAERCKEIATMEADLAAMLTQTHMSNAVAELVPTFEKSFRDAALSAANRVQLGSSMLSVAAGMVALGFAFAIGWLGGSNVLGLVQQHLITGAQFWDRTSTGLCLGISCPFFVLAGYLLMEQCEKRGGARFWSAVTLFFLGVAGIGTMIARAFA
jgi:hypothetical protein